MLSITTKLNTSKNFVSIILVIIALVLSTLVFTSENYKNPDFVRHDMTSYYGYLPAFFIHHDLSLKFNESLNSHYFAWCTLVENGKIFRSTMGVSIMLLPFYALAELITWLGGFDRTGFTPVYFLCLAFAPVFYLLLGLWLIVKTLKLYVFQFAIALSLITLVFATNLFHYVINEGIMSHIYSFAMYAVFIYATVNWHRKPSISFATLIGLSFGMLVLIRPIHGVSVLFFLCYDLSNFKLKYHYLSHVLIIGIVSFLCVLPQMLYWKVYAGHWIFYSYGNEGFFFLASKFIYGLFSFRSGWLVYSPIMALSFIGMYFMYREWKAIFLSVVIFSAIYIYVVFSWWCWWYGASFSSRSMVDVCPVFVIPLAILFQKISSATLGKVLLTVVVIGFSALNLFQTWQYNHGIIHYEGMNKQLYLRVFGATEFPYDYVQLRSYPNYDDAIKGKRNE